MIENLTKNSNENDPHSLVNVPSPSHVGDSDKLSNKNSELIKFKVIEKHWKDGKREVFINNRLVHEDKESIFNNIKIL